MPDVGPDRLGERRLFDAYYTPAYLAAPLVAQLPLRVGDRALEPHVGAGAFARALHARTGRVECRDLDPHAPGLAWARERGQRWAVADFLLEPPAAGAYDVVAGNPPYECFVDHVLGCLAAVRPDGGHVALLLRTAMTSGLGAYERLWRPTPPRRIWYLVRRVSFTEDGHTDRHDYAWVWWTRGWTGPTVAAWLDLPAPPRPARGRRRRGAPGNTGGATGGAT